RGPFAWYFLGPVGQSSPLSEPEDYSVGRPRTFFTLPPPRTAGRGPAPRPGGAMQSLLSSCPQPRIDRKRKAEKRAFPALCNFPGRRAPRSSASAIRNAVISRRAVGDDLF